eukprot:6193159-Pleurochrysis_carterae.AAC.3
MGAAAEEREREVAAIGCTSLNDEAVYSEARSTPFSTVKDANYDGVARFEMLWHLFCRCVAR